MFLSPYSEIAMKELINLHLRWRKYIILGGLQINRNLICKSIYKILAKKKKNMVPIRRTLWNFWTNEYDNMIQNRRSTGMENGGNETEEQTEKKIE